MYLEQYLLSLYRKIFNQQISTKGRRLELATDINKGTFTEPNNCAISDKEISVLHSSHLISPRSSASHHQLKECSNQLEPESVLDSSIHRCYSALSQQTAFSIEASPGKIKTKALECYHSLPLSMLEVSIIRNRREVVTLHRYISFADH